MKSFLIVLLAGALALVVWRLRVSTSTPNDDIDRLRTAIESSELPEHARAEMSALIEAGRLRPSQVILQA